MSRPPTLPVSKAVIDRVARLRKGRRISALKFAALMSEAGYPCSRSTIAQTEGGYRKEISVDWLWAASTALNIPVKSLLLGPECPSCHDDPPSGFTCNSCHTEGL